MRRELCEIALCRITLFFLFLFFSEMNGKQELILLSYSLNIVDVDAAVAVVDAGVFFFLLHNFKFLDKYEH